MTWLSDPEAWIALVTLSALEIVLGIDNIIFISILVGRLPKAVQQRARTIGLALAMLTRILLLLSITWVMGLSSDLFSVGSLGPFGYSLNSDVLWFAAGTDESCRASVLKSRVNEPAEPLKVWTEPKPWRWKSVMTLVVRSMALPSRLIGVSESGRPT